MIKNDDLKDNVHTFQYLCGTLNRTFMKIVRK